MPQPTTTYRPLNRSERDEMNRQASRAADKQSADQAVADWNARCPPGTIVKCQTVAGSQIFDMKRTLGLAVNDCSNIPTVLCAAVGWRDYPKHWPLFTLTPIEEVQVEVQTQVQHQEPAASAAPTTTPATTPTT